MSGITEMRVPGEAAGERLDRWLATALTDVSRSQVARLIDDGRVLVAGKPGRASLRLAGGEDVRVDVPPPPVSTLVAAEGPLTILFEDADLLVLDKPAGLVVHPGAGIKEGTLVHALLHHCGASLAAVGGEGRPGIVHRLDKDTTGVLAVAKTPAAYRSLTAQFADRTVRKTYLAVVFGIPEKEGVVEAAIARSRSHRTRMAVSKDGRPALSTWRVREIFGRSAALVEVDLRTGRTHQARVHMAHAGHGIVGDEAYKGGGGVPQPVIKGLLAAFRRPALHAFRLELDHPRTGERLTFEAPLPADMATLVTRLREALGTSPAPR